MAGSQSMGRAMVPPRILAASESRTPSPPLWPPDNVECDPEDRGMEEGDSDPARRLKQRSKQIQFGYNTQGYHNMMRLLNHDPRLRNGGVLPLEPPPADLHTSKRQWDLLIRKWRRALHMFDHVLVEGEDEVRTSLADVVEQQRQQWVSPRFSTHSKVQRVRLRREEILAARSSPLVPKKLPVEHGLVPLLRSLEHYDPIASLLPDNAPLNSTPQTVGIKILIAPLAAGETFGGSPATSPVHSRSPSPNRTIPRLASIVAGAPATVKRGPNAGVSPPRSPSPSPSPSPVSTGLFETTSPAPEARKAPQEEVPMRSGFGSLVGSGVPSKRSTPYTSASTSPKAGTPIAGLTPHATSSPHPQPAHPRPTSGAGLQGEALRFPATRQQPHAQGKRPK